MSTLNVANITDGTDTVETGYVVNGSAKAWVNFNGTGTIAIRDSLNVSSLTDNDVGYYTVSSTNSFNNSNYSTSVTSNRAVSTNFPVTQHAIELGTGYVLVLTVRYDNGGFVDSNLVFVQNFGDLA
jgi:hypothetical protein